MGINYLIERLEALTGPSREVDAEIAILIGVVPEGMERCGPGWWGGGGEQWEAPRYTESLDAALPGEDIIGTSEQKQIPGQPIKWVAVHRMPKGRYQISGMGRTEVLARRIAALRARETEGK